MSNILTVEQYSEKSIVVRGNVKLDKYKEVFEKLKGLYNANLRGKDGYIFSLSKRNQIEKIVEQLNKGTFDYSTLRDTSSNFKDTVPIKDFLSLVSRVEKLEYIINNLQHQNINKKIENNETYKTEKKEKIESKGQDDRVPKRLLTKKH